MFAVAQNDLARKREEPSPDKHSRAPIPQTHNSVWDAVATSSFVVGPPRVQTKLAVSQPGDPYEQEADRVAEQVMRMPEPIVHPKCAACMGGAGSCLQCEGEKNDLAERKTDSSSDTTASSDATSLTPHLGPGQPLDPGTRSFFEPRLGHDFSGVRIHIDEKAAGSARMLQASAYTIGRDVVFAEGRYAPSTLTGQRLLAHELEHVRQQAGGVAGTIRREPIESDDLVSDVPIPLDKPELPPTNKAPSCDEICGNTANTCAQGPGEHCTDTISKKVGAAWKTAATQLTTAIDALAESPLSATTLGSLKSNFKWSPGNAPNDLPTTVRTNLSTASTKMSDNLCIKCLGECPQGAKAQITRARGKNCLGPNCFTICPNFSTDTHVLVHELFHRVDSNGEDLYRGQPGYPPPPSMALKMPDCYAS